MKISKQIQRLALNTRVIQNIEAIPLSAFNSIFPHVHEAYHFFKTLEASQFDQFNFYYILAYQKKKLVGIAPCFSVDYSLDTSINGPLRGITNAIKKAFPRLFSLKALVCGIPMGQGQIGLGADNKPIILQAIQQRLESLAHKIHAPISAFKDFDDSYTALFNPLLDQGYIKIDSLPMTRLKIDFSDFESYLKKLSSASRYDYRRKLKKTAQLKIECTSTNTLDDKTLDEAYALYLQVVTTHDMGFEIVPKAFFALMAKNMPDATRFFLWRIEGKLAGFVFALIEDDVLLHYYIGLDYALAYEHHLYFITVKDMMNYCFTQGIKTFEMGTTGYEFKRRLGFDFIPVFMYVKTRYRILRPGLQLLCSLLKFENFDPVLKEWKKSSQ